MHTNVTVRHNVAPQHPEYTCFIAATNEEMEKKLLEIFCEFEIEILQGEREVRPDGYIYRFFNLSGEKKLRMQELQKQLLKKLFSS